MLGRILLRPYIAWGRRTSTLGFFFTMVCALFGFDLTDLYDIPAAVEYPPDHVFIELPKALERVASDSTDYSDAFTCDLSPTPLMEDVDLDTPATNKSILSLLVKVASDSSFEVVSPQPTPPLQTVADKIVEQTTYYLGTAVARLRKM